MMSNVIWLTPAFLLRMVDARSISLVIVSDSCQLTASPARGGRPASGRCSSYAPLGHMYWKEFHRVVDRHGVIDVPHVARRRLHRFLGRRSSARRALDARNAHEKEHAHREVGDLRGELVGCREALDDDAELVRLRLPHGLELLQHAVLAEHVEVKLVLLLAETF